jgi:shikimate kinase
MVGFMGAGKSTVGTMLSRDMGLPFIDLDRTIEAQEHASVAELFQARGEEAFRDLESEALASLANVERAVVACGGGIVLRPQNRILLAELGRVVYLQGSAGEAIARIGDTATRPLLAGSAGTITATSLLSAREALYRSVADLTVDTAGKSAEEVAAAVAAALEESG